jgi:putative copper export protein
MFLSHHLVSVLVRWAHVAAMASVLGGAILLWGLTLRRRDRVAPEVVAQLARTYEWIFWAAMGLLVMTGVGNLGAFGDQLPRPQTRWGETLTLKLVAVLALVVASVPRTLLVAAMAGGRPSVFRGKVPAAVYGLTTLALASVLGIATFLAHG